MKNAREGRKRAQRPRARKRIVLSDPELVAAVTAFGVSRSFSRLSNLLGLLVRIGLREAEAESLAYQRTIEQLLGVARPVHAPGNVVRFPERP